MRASQWSEGSHPNGTAAASGVASGAQGPSMAPSMFAEPHGDNPFEQAQVQEPRHRPPWAIATDVFWERYGRSVQGTAGKHRNLAFIKALSGEAFSPGPIEWPTDGAAAGEASPGLAEPWLVQALSGKEPGGVKAGASATRPRLLFQYKPYSQQGALNLSQTEVAAVLEAVFGKPVDPRSGTPTPSPLPRGTPGAGTEHNTALSAAGDVGAVVLIKLIMDLYLRVGAQAAFALVLYMFQAPLVHGPPAARCRVFDVLANLAVHAEMLRAAPADNVPEDTEAVAQAVAGLDPSGPSGEWRATVTSALRASMALSPDSHNVPAAGCGSNSRTSAYEDDELLWPRLPQPLPWDCIDVEVERFRQWLRLLLFRLLSLLCSVEGEAGMAWASALACLVSLVTFEGRVVRAYAEELTLDVVAEMISQAQASLWPMPLRCWLEVLAANLLYTRDMHFEGNGPENGHTTGILAGSIDSERLAAFGGPGAVLRCFMQATTQRSRHAFFCVLFDIAASGIAGAPSTAQVPEVQLIGAALLRLRAPEAVHAILTAEATTLGGAQGSSAEMLQGLAEAARELLAEWQAANPAEVPRVSPNLLADCFASLGRVLSAECRIPSDLESAFHSTIEGLGSSGAGITAGAALGDDWDALADALRDTSALGMSVASAWLRQILISAAEQDIERSLAEGRHPGALLPAPDIRPASWKVHDVHAMSSVPEIKALLAAVLPEPTGTAANTFIGAVKALLDHVRMRAAGLALRQNYVGAGKTGASWHAVHAPTVALATLLLAVDWLNLTPAAARRPAMVQAAECLVSWLVVRKLDDQSAEDAAASQGIAPVKPDAASVPGYGALAPSDAEAAHVAMHATQPQTGPGTPASIQQAHRTAPSTPLPSVSPLESKSSRPQSGLQGAPLAKIVPVPKLAAAWRRLTAPHASRPRQSSLDEDEGPSRPLSAGVAALGGAPYSHVEPSAGQPAGGQRTEQGSNVRFQEPLPEPQPPSAVEERHQHRHSMLGGGASLLDIAAERAAEEQQSAAAEQGAWARALAEAEASVGAVQSFLEGLSGCQGELLQHVDPAYFRAVFDALRPPAAEVSLSAGTPGGRPSTPGPPHSGLRGHPAGSSAVNGPLSRLSALQEGRPLWDARAAVLALLLARCTLESQGDGGHPAGLFGDDSVADGTLAAKAVDSAFLASLLSDPDSRVRRHASVYVLGRSAMKDPARHRAAMRAVVAKAQRGDDERLLTSPEAQVSTLLEMRVLVPGDLA